MRRVAEAAGWPWERAVATASLVPAGVLGVDDRLGSVEQGLVADLVGWDAARHVAWTMVGGRIGHRQA